MPGDPLPDTARWSRLMRVAWSPRPSPIEPRHLQPLTSTQARGTPWVNHATRNIVEHSPTQTIPLPRRRHTQHLFRAFAATINSKEIVARSNPFSDIVFGDSLNFSSIADRMPFRNSSRSLLNVS